MKRCKTLLSCITTVLFSIVLLTACNTASEAIANSDKATALPTKFEDSMTAQLFKEEDAAGCSYVDVDYIADFSSASAGLPEGIEITGLNLKGTARDKELYFKITYKMNSGNMILYCDNQYAYLVDDSERVLYRFKYGLSSDFVLSLNRNYEESAKNVTYFYADVITLFGEEYYSEQIIMDGNKQIWCYDQNNSLKYILYYNENDELSSTIVVNGYAPQFNDKVFTLPAYHVVDTGESLIL